MDLLTLEDPKQQEMQKMQKGIGGSFALGRKNKSKVETQERILQELQSKIIELEGITKGLQHQDLVKENAQGKLQADLTQLQNDVDKNKQKIEILLAPKSIDQENEDQQLVGDEWVEDEPAQEAQSFNQEYEDQLVEDEPVAAGPLNSSEFSLSSQPPAQIFLPPHSSVPPQHFQGSLFTPQDYMMMSMPQMQPSHSALYLSPLLHSHPLPSSIYLGDSPISPSRSSYGIPGGGQSPVYSPTLFSPQLILGQGQPLLPQQALGQGQPLLPPAMAAPLSPGMISEPLITNPYARHSGYYLPYNPRLYAMPQIPIPLQSALPQQSISPVLQESDGSSKMFTV